MTAVADVFEFNAPLDGPSLAVSVLMHGDEPCGLAALELARSESFALARGRLRVVVMNRPATRTPDGPVRHLGVDMNRVWSKDALARDCAETRRVQTVLPLLRDVDAILDIHSLPEQDRSFLLVSSGRPGALAVAARMRGAIPRIVIAPPPARRGVALFETELVPAATPIIVVECGRHDATQAPQVARDAFMAFLAAYGLVAAPGASAARDTHEAGIYEIGDEVVLREGPLRLERKMRGFDALRAGQIYGRDGTQPLIAAEDCHVLLTRPAHKPGDEALSLVRRLPDDAGITGQ